MKIDFAATGTAEDVAKLADEAGKRDTLASKSPSESAGVESVYDAIGTVLTAVEGDRQATALVQADVQPGELTRVYMDVTIVPSAKAQEAKAAADLVNVRTREPVPDAPAAAHDEEQ